MRPILISHNNYLQEKPLHTHKLFISNNYVTNKYDIDKMYNVSFTYKINHDPKIIKILRYQSNKTILFINFEFNQNVYSWSTVYNHFMKHYNDFDILEKKKYIHEVFQSDTPTRMFFDLDFKNISEKTIDSYIQYLIHKV